MSVLKKIGIVLATAGADITKFLGFPFISQLLGMIPGTAGTIIRNSVIPDLNTFAGFITTAEAMYQGAEGQKLGSQKLAAVTPLIEKAITEWAQSALPGHNKVKDPVLLTKAAGEIGSGMADAMNAFGD